jgi:hypothetical protein
MKLNHFAWLHGTQNGNSARRRKEQDAVRIDTALKRALDELSRQVERRAAFLRLVACVRAATPLLKPTPGRGTPGWIAPVFLLNRLKNLASRQSQWIRPCEAWHPQPSNLRSAFRSLAHHLLNHYPVPGFMDLVWDLADSPEGFRQQSYYIRLGRGVSFRELNLPLVLVRRMEHYVRGAPDHYSLSQALRYGETRGLGGSEGLAREVASGRLGQKIERPEFWRTVLIFFVVHPEMKLEHVNPIVDFIHANKFAGDEVLTDRGTEVRSAPWPDFSIKGRTMKSILRLVSAWHADLGISKGRRWLSWRKSGIPGYRFLERRPGEEGDRDWTILELLDSGALYAEGRAMHHCVYSYANRCHWGQTTIWSLRLRVDGEEKRMATIEVNPHRRSITQVRAKCNLRPGVRSAEIIDQWATQAGLGMEA